MDVEQAAAQIREGRPRLLYTLPDFQNPTGITQSLARRQRLAARRRSTPAVLEDDAYYDLRYEGEPLPPVTALASNPGGVYRNVQQDHRARSARRVSLRPATPRHVSGTPEAVDRPAAGSFTQRVALRFCERGLLEPQIALLRETYRARRRAAGGAGRSGPRWRGTVDTVDTSRGGMFVFVTLPPGMDAAALLPPAMERGVVYVPGASFHLDARSAETGLAGGQHAAPELRLRERSGHPSWHPPAGRYPA